MLLPIAESSKRPQETPASGPQPDVDEVEAWLARSLESKFGDKRRLLDWWKINENRFPGLALMARDVLAAPISSVGVERVFNIARDIISYRRGRLNPGTIRKLIISKHYLQRQRKSLTTQQSTEEDEIERELSLTASIEEDQIVEGIEDSCTSDDPISSDEEIIIQSSRASPQGMLRKPLTKKASELRSDIVRSNIATSKPLASTRPKNPSKKAAIGRDVYHVETDPEESSPTASADEGPIFSDDDIIIQSSRASSRKPLTKKVSELRSEIARSKIARSDIVRSKIATSKPLPSIRPKNPSKKAAIGRDIYNVETDPKKSSSTASADEGMSHAPLSTDSSSGEHGNDLERELFGGYTDGESEDNQYGSFTLDEAEMLENSQSLLGRESLPSSQVVFPRLPVVTISPAVPQSTKRNRSDTGVPERSLKKTKSFETQ